MLEEVRTPLLENFHQPCRRVSFGLDDRANPQRESFPLQVFLLCLLKTVGADSRQLARGSLVGHVLNSALKLSGPLFVCLVVRVTHKCLRDARTAELASLTSQAILGGFNLDRRMRRLPVAMDKDNSQGRTHPPLPRSFGGSISADFRFIAAMRIGLAHSGVSPRSH